MSGDHSPQDSDAAPSDAGLTHLARLAAEVLQHVEQSDLLATLCGGIARLVPFDNFIVVYFEENCVAELVYTNLDAAHIAQQMAPYCTGLHLLDPFYIAATTGGRRGLLSLGEVAPDDFEQSEFFRTYYRNVDVLDEAHYIVALNAGQIVQVFVERERPAPAFATQDLARLRTLAPFVAAAVARHWQWRRGTQRLAASDKVPLGFNLRAVIQGLGGHALTQREVDIVELSLKGRSSKSIAAALDIGEGTVTNHKRNIYAKLDINSQAQLFHLFLQALLGGTPAAAAGGRRSPRGRADL